MVLIFNKKNSSRLNNLLEFKLLIMISFLFIFSLKKSIAQNPITINLNHREGVSVFTIGEIPSILIKMELSEGNKRTYVRAVNFQPDYYEYQLFKKNGINILRRIQKVEIDTANWDFDQQLLVKSWQDNDFKYIQLDIDNDNTFINDDIYIFDKSKKDSILKNLPKFKISFNYNHLGLIKKGNSIIKLNPFDNYYSEKTYKSEEEKESDFVIQNFQFREGYYTNKVDSIIFEVINIFPYPDYTNNNFININIVKNTKNELNKNFSEIVVNKIKDTIRLGSKNFILDSVSQFGEKLYLKQIKEHNYFYGYNVGDTIRDLNFLNTILTNDENKLYLLDFWGIWCKPCVELIPEIKLLNDKYKDKLKIISIAVDNKMEIAKYENFVFINKMNWNQVYLKNGFKSELIDRLKINFYPTTILINRFGKILFRGNTDHFKYLTGVIDSN